MRPFAMTSAVVTGSWRRRSASVWGPARRWEIEGDAAAEEASPRQHHIVFRGSGRLMEQPLMIQEEPEEGGGERMRPRRRRTPQFHEEEAAETDHLFMPSPLTLTPSPLCQDQDVSIASSATTQALVQEKESDVRVHCSRDRCAVLHIRCISEELRYSNNSDSNNNCALRASEASQHFLTVVLHTLMSGVRRERCMVVSLNFREVVAAWNAHTPSQNPEGEACVAARELCRSLSLNRSTSSLRCVVTVASGRALYGTCGSGERVAHYVTGDCIDFGEKLLDLCCVIASQILVTESVYERVAGDPRLPLFPVDKVQGESDGIVTLYQLDWDKSTKANGGYERNQNLFHSALFHFHRGEYEMCTSVLSTWEQNVSYGMDCQALRILHNAHYCATHLGPGSSAVSSELRYHFRTPQRRFESWEDVTCLAELPPELMEKERCVLSALDTNALLHGSLGFAKSIFRRSGTLKDASILRAMLHDQTQSRADGGTPNVATPGASCLEVSTLSPAPVDIVLDCKGRSWTVSSKVLGRGGKGIVYMGMGRDASLVAVKKLPVPVPPAGVGGRRVSNINHSAMVEEVVREVDMLSSQRHQNIVAYCGCAVVDSTILIVMEYVSGGSLHSIRQSFHNFPHSCLRKYCKDILRGLAFLHERDIVHRDVKPHNVLVTTDGTCKLTDFGASATVAQLSGEHGVTTGTPVYMAPEQCRGEAEKASDIWSFGILLLELLTGEVPWPPALVSLPPAAFCYRHGREETFRPLVRGRDSRSVGSPGCTQTLRNESPPCGPREHTQPAVWSPRDVEDIAEKCLTRVAVNRPTAMELLQYPFFA